MSDANNPSPVVSTERVLSVNPRDVFALFEQPDRLAQWWGPNGFRNTFEQFEFAPGGRWIYVMRGPNGVDYLNESVFREVMPDTRIVIEHVSKPRFILTVTLQRKYYRATPEGAAALEQAKAKLRELVSEVLHDKPPKPSIRSDPGTDDGPKSKFRS